jgi:hypothetical protein
MYRQAIRDRKPVQLLYGSGNVIAWPQFGDDSGSSVHNSF